MPYAVISNRWLDEVLLREDYPDVGGADIAVAGAHSGIGDLAIMEIMIVGTGVATLVNLATKPGVRVDILSADGTSVVDFVAAAEWFGLSETAVVCYITPDPLVLWKEGERLRIASPEFDTNAVPTGDLRVEVKTVRIRPGTQTRQRLQLVR